MGKNIRVFVYLTVSFDVLGPWVFQKYGIILSFKDIVGMVTNDQPNVQTTSRVNLEQVSSWNIE